MAVLDALQAVNSARVDDRLTELRRTLSRHADVPAVRDVEERSRELLGSACVCSPLGEGEPAGARPVAGSGSGVRYPFGGTLRP